MSTVPAKPVATKKCLLPLTSACPASRLERQSVVMIEYVLLAAASSSMRNGLAKAFKHPVDVWRLVEGQEALLSIPRYSYAKDVACVPTVQHIRVSCLADLADCGDSIALGIPTVYDIRISFLAYGGDPAALAGKMQELPIAEVTWILWMMALASCIQQYTANDGHCPRPRPSLSIREAFSYLVNPPAPSEFRHPLHVEPDLATSCADPVHTERFRRVRCFARATSREASTRTAHRLARTHRPLESLRSRQNRARRALTKRRPPATPTRRPPPRALAPQLRGPGARQPERAVDRGPHATCSPSRQRRHSWCARAPRPRYRT